MSPTPDVAEFPPPTFPELPLPANLARGDGSPERTLWLATLPPALERARELWSLESVGAPFAPGGQTAWVAPARSTRFGDAVLKLALRHSEARDEAPGLAEWNGVGAVRLLASADLDERTTALLLERCRPGASLATLGEAAQDRVIARLLPQLWKQPPFSHPFRELAEMCDVWADGVEARNASRPHPQDPGLIRAGVALFRSLPRDVSCHVLLCTDLHAENVISADREPWLAIDPKPYVGDPTYDVLQHMLNCPDRLNRDPAAFAGQLASLLDLEADRLRLWLFSRCVVGSIDSPELLSVARRLAPA